MYAGLAKINYCADRDQDALLSVLRVAPAATRAAIEPSLRSIRRFADEQSERLRRAAERRAAELGAPAPVEAAAPPADPRREPASRIVVRRKRFGPVTLDDLPLERREGFPGFGGSPAPLPLLTWCDGQRTLAEVIRLIELEQGPMDFDFVGYFQFLGKHGYVELLPAARQ